MAEPAPADQSVTAMPSSGASVSRGVREGSRRQTLDLPADDYRWLHEWAREQADSHGLRARDLSAQHLLRAAVLMMRPDGPAGDEFSTFRTAVLEQATREAAEVARAEQSTREQARAAKDQARTQARRQ